MGLKTTMPKYKSVQEFFEKDIEGTVPLSQYSEAIVEREIIICDMRHLLELAATVNPVDPYKVMDVQDKIKQYLNKINVKDINVLNIVK
jgi:hypothetical protein